MALVSESQVYFASLCLCHICEYPISQSKSHNHTQFPPGIEILPLEERRGNVTWQVGMLTGMGEVWANLMQSTILFLLVKIKEASIC